MHYYFESYVIRSLLVQTLVEGAVDHLENRQRTVHLAMQ